MNYKEVESRITTLLEENEHLRSIWIDHPSLAHLPYMGNRQHCFLMVSISVNPWWIDREKQVRESLAVAQVVISSGLLTDEKAVEVSAWGKEPRERHEYQRRVFRLSVYEVAYAEAMKVSASDLLSKPHEGITCQWPLTNRGGNVIKVLD